MKINLIALLLLFFSYAALAQTENENQIDKNNFWGTTLALNKSLSYPGIYLTPTINYYLNAKHNFFIGPNLLIKASEEIDINYYDNNQRPQSLSDRLGVYLGYRYYFLPVGKRVNFALMYSFQYNRGHFIITYASSEDYKLNLITQSVGYNLKIRLYDNFYFNQELGVGKFHKNMVFGTLWPNIHLNAGVGYWFRK